MALQRPRVEAPGAGDREKPKESTGGRLFWRRRRRRINALETILDEPFLICDGRTALIRLTDIRWTAEAPCFTRLHKRSSIFSEIICTLTSAYLYHD